MKSNQLLILGALGLGAFLLLRKKPASTTNNNTPEVPLRRIKSTAVDWSNSNVTVDLAYDTLFHTGKIDPTTKLLKTFEDKAIEITGNGQQTSIKFIKNKQIEKQATIDFYSEKLFNFDAGSVGISGYSNIDTVTSMYGIGSIPKYHKLVLEAAEYIVDNDMSANKKAKFLKSVMKTANINDEYRKRIFLSEVDSAIMDILYPEKIGSTYSYSHPKAITLCTDGNYSDSHKGACSYRGGAYAIKLRNGQRDYTGKGKYELYAPYRKAYKSAWAKRNRASDKVTTL